MTLYCDVDGTLLDSSARHEKLLRDLLAVRGLAWPAAAPDYMRYKADGHSTKAWLALAGLHRKSAMKLPPPGARALKTGLPGHGQALPRYVGFPALAAGKRTALCVDLGPAECRRPAGNA